MNTPSSASRPHTTTQEPTWSTSSATRTGRGSPRRARRRTRARACLWNNQALATRIERLLLGLEASYRAHVLPPNPVVDADFARRLRTDAGPAGAFAPLRERWQLASVCVDPRYQRRGVGRMLVAWRLERSREEGAALGLPPLPAVLVASVGGFALYARLGFRVLAWVGEELEMDAGGGAAMVWDEGGVWVRAVGEGDEVGSRGGQRIEVVYRGGEGDGGGE